MIVSGIRNAQINSGDLITGAYIEITKFIAEIINEKLTIERLIKNENFFIPNMRFKKNFVYKNAPINIEIAITKRNGKANNALNWFII